MSHHRQDNSRPRKGPRVSKWQEKGQKDDDMIAPDGVSRSTDHLERWALMTADMPQQTTKRAKSRVIEEEIHERIRKRYYFPRHLWPKTTQDDPEPADERMVIDLTADDDAPEEAPSPATTKKRRRSPSPDWDNSRSRHSTHSNARHKSAQYSRI
ncbi:hypothetical protein ACET3X_003778 [Alternaria dauci]|uniref:Uncharacterized protein n=1 Tax=Alternaria dauci TaxID=48095 RepID=A0ABR3ULS0_9PLEO